MTPYSLRLPESLMRAVRQFSKKDGASMNQFFISAIAEKISALETEEYLKLRADKADFPAFESILAKVPDSKPLKGDEL